jgi:hypothetical protein
MSRLPVFHQEKTCDECGDVFRGPTYGEDVCRTCRSMLALEQIAETLREWVRLQ